MDEVKIPNILSPEAIEALNANSDSLKFIFEPEDGEIICEGGKCCIKDCSKIDRVKFVLCDVKIDVKNAECNDSHLEEIVKNLRKQLYIKRKQIREIWEHEQKEKEELLDLISEFAFRSKQIRNIYEALKRHEQIIIDLEARIEEKIKMYRLLPGQYREDLCPSLKHDIQQLKRGLCNEHILIEKIERVLIEKLESRKRVGKVINKKTEGIFAELFHIYSFAENGL